MNTLWRKVSIKKSHNDLRPLRAVFLNRGAAEPLCAVESSRGAANLWTLRLFTVARGVSKLLRNEGRVPRIKKGWETNSGLEKLSLSNFECSKTCKIN